MLGQIENMCVSHSFNELTTLEKVRDCMSNLNNQVEILNGSNTSVESNASIYRITGERICY